MAKNKAGVSGIVYSTDPAFVMVNNDEAQDTLAPALQKLRVKLETKHRAGKAVTLVEGFVGSANDAAELGKRLKAACGTGGSVKETEIIVQGDNRDKVLGWLMKNGYVLSKKTG